MHTLVYEEAVRGDSDELLTTGEAASLLGVSRQQVVNMAERGDLPYEMSGTHRRIRRSDVERARFSTRRMSADQRRSLRLGYAIAGKIVQQPDAALSLGRANLDRLRAQHVRGQAAQWLAQWQRLIDGPLDELLLALTSPSPRGRELRQNSPFAGVLDESERAAVLAATR